MYRKRPTDSSESSANSSFRSRLKAGEIKAPATRRPALSSIQPRSGGTSKSSNRPTNAFSFGDDENDTPDEEDMDVTQPPTSQLNQTNNRLQASVTFDRLIEDEDVEAERNEVNPRVVANASTNIRTQAQIHGPRIETGGEDAEGFESNIFQRLKELGVEVKTNDNETYFYLGDMTHAKLIKLIERKWPDVLAKKIMDELKDELKNNPESWSLFTKQSQNINGIQDTMFRALILCQYFQKPVFDLLITELNSVATKSGEEDMKFGQDILLQLRFITQVFDANYLFQSIFAKRKIETWNPVLRDELIEILPELFADPSVHFFAAKKLKDFILNGNLPEHKSLQAACLSAIKCFEIDGCKAKDEIYDVLSENLMNFHIENLPLAIETLLKLMNKSKADYLSNFFFHLSKYLDIEKLKRDEELTEETKVDECISQVFFRITEYMRFNLNKTEKELAVFYEMAKIHRVAAKGFKKNKKPVRINSGIDSGDDESDVSMDEEEEDVENPNDPDFTPSEYGDVEDEKIRDFDLIDVMLLFCINEASNNSALVFKELRKQISLSYENVLNLKEVFIQAMGFHSFTEEHACFSSVLRFAGELVQSPNPTINEFGTIVYKHLFYNLSSDRQTVLTYLSKHLGEVDSETTAALSVLQEIAVERIEILRNFVDDLNGFVEHLSFLSTENIRRLFYVLVSVNFHPPSTRPTQAQIRQKTNGDKFIKRLHHYLTSNISREVIYGVIGLIQYVKVLLQKKDGDNNDQEIFDILIKLNNVTKEMSGKVRAEFYIQMSDLLKPMKDLGECEALYKFSDGLTKYVRTKIYKQKPPPPTSNLGIYDKEDFIDASSTCWINLADLVLKDKELTGTICGLLPLLQLVKDFATYRESFLDNSDPSKTEYWSSFMFILEANINLSQISNSTDLTDAEHLRRCNVLYVAIEYLRTVMNMFAECRCNNEKVQLWLDKKLNLMALCQTNMKGSISKLGTYSLPRISHVNKDDLIVKSKDAKKPKSKKKTPEPTDESMDEDSRDASVLHGNDDSNDASGLGEKFKTFNLRKFDGPKTISSDQLQWYCIPLRLETVTRLLQLKDQKLRLILFLVETFHVILKHTLPVKGKHVPVGFGLGSAAPLPYATMDFGSKESRWNNVAAAIRPLFDILSKTVHTFQNNSTQVYTISNDTMEGFSALLKFCVMIFSRIFQSREIAVECDHQDTDRTGTLQTRRAAVLSVLNHEINVFDSSTHPQGGDMTRNNLDTSVTDGLDVSIGSFIHGRISDVVRVSEPMNNRTEEGNVIEFFLNVANHVSTLESAAAMLALFKTFDSMEEFQTRRCAILALQYLSKKWKEDDENLDEKHAILIATEYIYFRPDNEKLIAITWLIWHQLLELYPNEVLSRANIEVGSFVDPVDYVAAYKGSVFPCFEKIPQWHRFLFKLFIDNLFELLKKSGKSPVDKRLVKEWRKHIETFYVLVLAIDNPKFRVHNVLYTIIKEGKRFISFIFSKQSSFGACIRNKETMSKCKADILLSLRVIQSANKLLFYLQANIKDKKAHSLLRLLPELKGAQEKMSREFYDAAAEGGFNDAVEYSFLKCKPFKDDRTEKKTPKKAAAKKPKGDKPAAKKRTKKPTDGPAKKRAKKTGSDVVIETNFDDSILAFGDSTRNIDGTVDVEDESAMDSE